GLSSTSLSEPSSAGDDSEASRLSSNSLEESSFFGAGLGVEEAPASRLSSNSTSSLEPGSREIPLSAGDWRLIPLLPGLRPVSLPRVSSSLLPPSEGGAPGVFG